MLLAEEQLQGEGDGGDEDDDGEDEDKDSCDAQAPRVSYQLAQLSSARLAPGQVAGVSCLLPFVFVVGVVGRTRTSLTTANRVRPAMAAMMTTVTAMVTALIAPNERRNL